MNVKHSLLCNAQDIITLCELMFA